MDTVKLEIFLSNSRRHQSPKTCSSPAQSTASSPAAVPSRMSSVSPNMVEVPDRLTSSFEFNRVPILKEATIVKSPIPTKMADVEAVKGTPGLADRFHEWMEMDLEHGL